METYGSNNKAITNDENKSNAISTEAPTLSFALRAQKKILGKFASRSLVKHFITDASIRIFDTLYAILKDYYGKKDVAEKTIKNILKIAIKLGVLMRDDKMSPEQEQYFTDFQKKFRSLTLTILSFATVEYSYDRNFLMSQLDSTKTKLDTLVGMTLSEKSKRRVSQIFGSLSDTRLLDEMFIKKGAYHAQFRQMVQDLEKLEAEKP